MYYPISLVDLKEAIKTFFVVLPKPIISAD